MKFEIVDSLQYTESHEWIDNQNSTVRVGITDFAQDELGDIVFVELPDDGQEFDQGDVFGVIESIKAVSDLYSPVTGTVTAVNESLLAQPELVNEDPFGDGWLIEIEPTEPIDGLLSATEYREVI